MRAQRPPHPGLVFEFKNAGEVAERAFHWLDMHPVLCQSMSKAQHGGERDGHFQLKNDEEVSLKTGHWLSVSV